MKTQKQQRRLYKLHYNLRRKGNTLIAREKTLFKRAKLLTDVENKWIAELLPFGYGIMDGIFTPPPLRGIKLVNYGYNNRNNSSNNNSFHSLDSRSAVGGCHRN